MLQAHGLRRSLVSGLLLVVCAGFAPGKAAGQPGIQVSPIHFPSTSKDGSTITLTFTMLTQPASDVTLALESNVLTEGTVSPSSVTFTPDTWDTPRTATVTGVDDDVRDGAQAYMIFVGPAVSKDPDYDGLQPANVPMINADNDFGRFYTLTPCRLFDSRLPADGPDLSSEITREINPEGRCGIPALAAALAVNVTVTQPTAAGDLMLHSGNDRFPLSNTVSFGPGQTRAGNAIVPLRFNNGTLSLSPVMAGEGTVHVIVDVTGYFD